MSKINNESGIPYSQQVSIAAMTMDRFSEMELSFADINNVINVMRDVLREISEIKSEEIRQAGISVKDRSEAYDILIDRHERNLKAIRSSAKPETNESDS